ncbi:hypothetical protein [Serratia marcescens]|uniref:hypothetical protein n=1 Tax=Serratia marcescens TaxID=615 RepID=UPI00148C2AFA|nr:hypothetical protein [Serratia marcescens]
MRKSTFAALLLLCMTPALALGAAPAPHAIIKTAPVYPETGPVEKHQWRRQGEIRY